MKLLSAALAATLLAPQAPAAPLVLGSQAATIRSADIAAITRAVAPYGGAPWLLTGFRSSAPAIGGLRQWDARVIPCALDRHIRIPPRSSHRRDDGAHYAERS